MGRAYIELLENREEIMFQHQANAAAGDPALREPIRREFMRLFDDVGQLSGASEEEVWNFIVARDDAQRDRRARPAGRVHAGEARVGILFFRSPDRSINHKEDRRWNGKSIWTLAIVSVALFMVTLDNLVVTNALVSIREDLGARPRAARMDGQRLHAQAMRSSC